MKKTPSPQLGCRCCIDRILSVSRILQTAGLAVSERPDNHPGDVGDALDENQLAQARRVVPSSIDAAALPVVTRIAFITGKKWAPGRRLKVRFMDGDPVVQAKVAEVAKIWEQYANIHFDFVVSADSDIRISFLDNGSWSYIGTDALGIPKSAATMNYGWLTKTTDDAEYHRVVLHEFGHALGCIHEHQHPKNGIKWNKAKVYADLGSSPNFWSKEEVDHNMFEKYSTTITQFSTFDKTSIMMYSFPPEWTTNHFSAPSNEKLSTRDKTWAAKAYPK